MIPSRGLAGLLTIIVAVCTVANGQAVQGTTRGSIAGTVTNLTTGEPIPGVDVDLIEPSGFSLPMASATSASDGSFIFNNVRPGEFLVNASLNVGGDTPKTWGRYVTITPGQHINDVQVRFIITSVLTGRVVDAKGQPMQSMQVTLLQRGYDRDGRPAFVPVPNVRAVTTDADGAYRFIEVWPGEYYVSAARSTGRLLNPMVAYYPGEAAVDRALPVVVPFNNEVRLRDFPALPEKTFSVRLEIRNADALGSIVLFLDPRGTGEFNSSSVSVASRPTNGVFRIEGVSAGSYRLWVRWLNPPGGIVGMDVDVADRDVDLGPIAIRPGVSIAGRIMFSDGSPAVFSVDLSPIPEFRGVHARALDATTIARMSLAERQQQARTQRPRQVLPDGTFVLDLVSEGQYRITVPNLESRPDLYIASARYGGRNVLDSLMTVDGGPPAGPLEIVIDGPAGFVQGSVRTDRDEPAAGARVALIPELHRRGNPDLFLSGVTDASGNFSMIGVPPGTYGVLAWTKIPDFAFRNAEFLRNYESRAVPVRVERGTRNVVNLRIIPILR